MRKTKIVCTMGPATENPEVLRGLMLAGMNVGRINFSHGNYKDQDGRVKMFKKIRDELGLPIPLLLDTQGPEIRIGKFESDEAILVNGATFTLLHDDVLGDDTKVSITYKNLHNEIDIGRTILVNDGTIELKVKEIVGKDIVCEVIQGGKLTNRKSINIPDFIVNLPGITEKDIEDIKYGIEAGFDYIAASFIRKPQDVLEIKQVLKENNGEHIKVISKIENREGIDNFDKILEVSDGIMIARGDLGVEIPMEEVPILQKQFIKKTYTQGKPVITATQMLESMISNPRPTRAEVSDVANAIFDGTTAIMLSGETATGMFPIECVKTMNKIAIAVEDSIKYWKRFRNRQYDLKGFDYEFNINYAICGAAESMEAKAIVAYTETGDMPRKVASFGPECPIFAITQNPITYRQLGLCWNINPRLFEPQETIDELLHVGVKALREEKQILKGDKVLIAGGNKALANLDECEACLNSAIGGIVEI